jgi:hypothetical protein
VDGMFRSGRGMLWKQPSEAILRRLGCPGGVWGGWSVSEVRAAFVTTFSTPVSAGTAPAGNQRSYCGSFMTTVPPSSTRTT